MYCHVQIVAVSDAVYKPVLSNKTSEGD